ncbi:DAK2 domain-containing protein [Acetobacteraceae bacterium]|nr:DAK2 domain-containing protein [Acetobacteraceae bacterium]
MKRFYNRRETIVKDALEGLLNSSYGADLEMLKNTGGSYVIVRADWDPNNGKVAVISGGGAGHEPMHAGFVGRGMLTSAVSGALFASPGSEDILTAIKAVTGEAGCLVIVKSYMGDRLNFASAVSQAQALDLKVEMVLVSDDVALGEGIKPRGLAGTLLVHKVAGAAAESGKSLEEVTALARETASSIYTIGLGLSRVHPYDAEDVELLGKDVVEIGIGIHGEPGVETIPYAPLDQLMMTLTERLLERAPKDGEFLLLVNMMAGSPELEALAIVSAIGRTKLAERVKFIIAPVQFCEGLDVKGVSLTVMPIREDLLNLLQAPAEPLYWKPPVPYHIKPLIISSSASKSFEDIPASSNPEVEKNLDAALNVLLKNEGVLNNLDATAGDGDTGSTYAEAARKIQNKRTELPFANTALLFTVLGRLLSHYSGGTSGALFSILFSNAGKETDWRKGLLQGVKKMQEYGGSKQGDRTVIDALLPAAECLAKGGSIAEAAKAARMGADATKGMKARVGRSSYVPPERLVGIPDAGAEGVARVFEAISKVDMS